MKDGKAGKQAICDSLVKKSMTGRRRQNKKGDPLDRPYSFSFLLITDY
jgi:hypothetical protein